MKCFNCKKDIKDETKSIHISDGDFVCDEKCKKEYIKNRVMFFSKIDDDKWYEFFINS